MLLFEVKLYCKGKEDIVLSVSDAIYHRIIEEDPREERYYIVNDSSTGNCDVFDNFTDLLDFVNYRIHNYDFYDLPF